MEYLKLYDTPDKTRTGAGRNMNSLPGIKRKLSALRSFYAYLFKQQMIKTNPTVMIDMPKIHEKTIVRLDADEVAILLDYVENCGSQLTGKALDYYKKTRERDIAIMTLLLCGASGVDGPEVVFDERREFGEEVESALKNYLEIRKGITPVAGHEHALFYSTQKRRLTVKAVENLVEKYASAVTIKHITPHKLRSTYGTALYRETGDIYLVADVLGHKDVNTTRRHYAAMDDERRRSAAGAVKLREN